MNEKELKTKVNEYFEKYMMVSFDKFLENFNESLEWCRYKDKEIERLNNIICDLEYELETEIKIGKETFPDDEFSNIVCETLKQVLKSLKELKGSDE